MTEIQRLSFFKMAACRVLPVSGISSSACVFASVYQISSKSVHNWSRYSVCRFYKMAATRVLPVSGFSSSACVFASV